MDDASKPEPNGAPAETKPDGRAAGSAHPSGRAGHGRGMQVLRGSAFGIYFTMCCILVHMTQLVGLPLYFINREWFYGYMAVTKQSFALITTVMTHVWGPTVMRISGDESVTDEIVPDGKDGVRFKLPERLVMIANHQIYTDWLYLWWIGYVNKPRMHGHIFIILKESLKYIPVIGPGMMFYRFIFMSRKMATDQPRLSYRLGKLKQRKTDPQGRSYLEPMWLLLFPEGTNLSRNGRRKSAAWAEKKGLKDPEHLMLPRSTGMYFCLNELKDSIEYVYDCTVAYEGVPRGKYGEELFGLASTYFEGRPPKSVNLYWRKLKLADIPLDDPVKFDLWLRDQWYLKDALIDQYLQNGRFPARPGAAVPYIEASVRTKYPWELLQIFIVPGICWLLYYNVRKVYSTLSTKMGFVA